MRMINDFIWSVRHTNEKLTNQCKMQEEIINGLFETLKNKIDNGKGH